jgi:sulfofructose kinase
MTRVVCIGVAVLDKIFTVDAIPPERTKVFARSYREIGGGPAATGAVTIARLGGQSTLLARVGDDTTGRRIVEEIAEWGVEPRIRLAPGGRSGVSAVVIEASGERTIFAFADATLDADPNWLPLAVLATADAILADCRWPRGSATVLHEARRLGVTSVLDADLASDDVLPMLAPLADHVVFSRPALARYTQADDPADGLRRARRSCSGVLGVTVGADGFLWLDGEEVRSVPAPQVTPQDTLGAGDVFHGAYALAIAEGRTVEPAAAFANAAAAIKCTRPGGRAGIPTREEVNALLSASRDG